MKKNTPLKDFIFPLILRPLSSKDASERLSYVGAKYNLVILSCLDYEAKLFIKRGENNLYTVEISFGCESHPISWWKNKNNITKICKRHKQLKYRPTVIAATNMLIKSYLSNNILITNIVWELNNV